MIFSLETALLRLGIAVLLGSIVGAERQFRDKSAGLRTLTLICVGSCLFTLASIRLTENSPDRIASMIVTGIGFLGGGVIFKSEEGVSGLTTAATIWATAAIGMATGSGLYVIAIFTCLVMLVVLSLFTKLEAWIDTVNKERTYRIVSAYGPDTIRKYDELIRELHLTRKRHKQARHGEDLHLSWKIKGARTGHDRFVDIMLRDETVKDFEY